MKYASCLYLVLLGCSAGAVPADTDSGISDEPTHARQYFEGQVVATTAIDLRAPSSAVSLGNYNRTGGWNVFEYLVGDGKSVKKGDLIAKFKFGAKPALVWINQRIKRVRAEREKRTLELQATLRSLNNARDKFDLDAEAARLDTLKKSMVSKRAQKLAEINYELARFERRAIRQRIKAHKVKMRAADAWYVERQAYADSLLARYHLYEKRCSLRAPYNGVVRYGRHPWHRRKILKSDGLPPGHAILSLAKDEHLSIRFFIPEAQSGSVKVGDPISAISLSGDVSWDTTVKKIEFFPQEIGFLRKDDNLPNAREKVYVGLATLPKKTTGLIAGNQVKVVRRKSKGGEL